MNHVAVVFVMAFVCVCVFVCVFGTMRKILFLDYRFKADQRRERERTKAQSNRADVRRSGCKQGSPRSSETGEFASSPKRTSKLNLSHENASIKRNGSKLIGATHEIID